MDLRSIGPVAGGPAQLEAELAAAAEMIDEPKLVVLYLPIDVDHAAWLAAARRAVRVPVVGATTAGAGFTERGVSRRHPVAAVLGGDQVELQVVVARDLATHAAQKIAAAAGKLVRSAQAARVRAPAIMTLSDAFACDGDVLLESLRRATPPHWRLFGGTAGDDWTFKGTRVFVGEEILEGAAVLVGVFGSMPPVLAAEHGFCPALGGRDLVITEIRGNVLVALDGEPAGHVYRRELERLGLLGSGEPLVRMMATYELGVRASPNERDHTYRIRAPLAVSDDGAIVLASTIEEGSVVRVMASTPDDLVEAARALGNRVRRVLEAEIHAALVFDCGARLRLLGDRYAEQVDAFFGRERFPCLGMTCYGEIVRFGGKLEGFHNTTAAIAAW